MRKVNAATIGIGTLVVSVIAPTGSPIEVEAANVVIVTTTVDSTAADGFTSLREAFDIANTDGDDTVLELAANANYLLTDCVAKEPIDFGNGFLGAPADDHANADGDLDHTADDDLTLNGNGAAVENTCLYDRVVHSTSPDARIILDDLTVTGGVGAPESGSNIWSIGGASLNDVTVLDGRRDVGSQIAALVVGESSPTSLGDLLLMTNSTVLGNEPGGVRIVNGDAVVVGSTIADNDGAGITISFGTMQIEDSVFIDNNGHGVSGIDASITVSGSALGGNSGYGVRNTGNADSGQPLNVVDSGVVANGLGGVRCSYCTGLNVTDSTVSDNDGTGISMLANVAGPTLAVVRSEIVANGGRSGSDDGVEAEGGGIEFEVEAGHTPVALISRSTISANESAPGVDGGGVRLLDAGANISNSTITLNQSDDRGGGIASSGVEPIGLEFVTLVENESAIGGANLDRGAAVLSPTATVIGQPIGTVNCVSGGLIVSGGFNQADDTTCDFGGGTGDLAPAPAPMLAPLADNGGAAPTRLPMPGSPVLGAVDGLACQSAPADQRDLPRPQGLACEVGAVEVDERPSAVIVAGSDAALKPDRVLRDWLADRDFVVTLLDDDDLDAASIADLDEATLVVVSSSVVPAKVGDRLTDVATPILVTEGYLIDDFDLASSSGETMVTSEIVIVTDPTTGLNGYTSVYTQPHRLSFGTPGVDAAVVATASFRQNVPVVFVYDQGDQLVGGAVAVAARGAFFFDYTGPNDARPASRQLFDHVVDALTS